MSIFNKLVTTTAFATLFLASMHEVHARIVPDETNETSSKKVLRIKLKQQQNGTWEAVSSRFLEAGESDLAKVIQSPPQTQEAWNPTEEELHRILEEADAEQAAKENSRKEEKKPSLNREENISSLLDTVAQNLPKAAEILQNVDKEDVKKEFTALGQTTVNNNRDILESVFGTPTVGGWSQSLSNSLRRGDERQTNQRLFGTYDKNHNIAKAASRDPNNKFIKIAATNPDAWNVLMSKQERFPGLLDRMNQAKAEAELKK